jgi:hypothetical protein
LSPERSAAVRGHLRTCEECRSCFEEERELVEAASQLPELEPPDAIWKNIEARIAQEEVKDSLESPAWRWLRLRWQPLGGVGLALAAAAFLILRPAGTTEDQKESVTRHEFQSSIAHAPPQISFTEARELELGEADRQYLQTIEDLRSMLEEDRQLWTAEEAAAVDARLAGFRKEAIGTRLAIGSAGAAVSSRDQLYAGYRSEIGFLQSALAGDLPGGNP